MYRRDLIRSSCGRRVPALHDEGVVKGDDGIRPSAAPARVAAGALVYVIARRSRGSEIGRDHSTAASSDRATTTSIWLATPARSRFARSIFSVDSPPGAGTVMCGSIATTRAPRPARCAAPSQIVDFRLQLPILGDAAGGIGLRGQAIEQSSLERPRPAVDVGREPLYRVPERGRSRGRWLWSLPWSSLNLAGVRYGRQRGRFGRCAREHCTLGGEAPALRGISAAAQACYGGERGHPCRGGSNMIEDIGRMPSGRRPEPHL